MIRLAPMLARGAAPSRRALLNKRRFNGLSQAEAEPSLVATWLRAVLALSRRAARRLGTSLPELAEELVARDQDHQVRVAALDDVALVGGQCSDPIVGLFDAMQAWDDTARAPWAGMAWALEDVARSQPLPTKVADFAPAEIDAAIDAASVTLERLAELIDALDESSTEPQADAQSLNAEAGRHAVTTDPRELLAALDAALLTWNAYPYCEARYAVRGRRFTRSDSAWLVTLAGESDAWREERIGWLVGLLARRGMPSLLLEDHLFALQEALAEAVPERKHLYESLGQSAAQLRHRRLDAVPAFDAIAETFVLQQPIARIGALLVSCVADERLGQPGTAESWLTDPSRFEPEWIDAVQRTLAQARKS